MATNYGEVLKAFVERIERIQAEVAERKLDIKEIYGEANQNGLNAKALRRIIAERRQDKADLAAMAEIMDLYRRSLGMLADTPLGTAALSRHGTQYQDESGLTVVVKGAVPPI